MIKENSIINAKLQENKGLHKRRINLRFFLLTSLSVVVSIFLGILFYIQSMAALVLLILFNTVFYYAFVWMEGRRQKPVKAIALIAAIALSIIAFVATIYEQASWHPDNFVSGSVYAVSGSVDSNVVKYGNRLVVIDNITLNGNEVRGKLKIYLDESEGFMEFAKEGDIVSFTHKVVGSEIRRNYRRNHRYYSSVSQSSITLEFGEPSFLQRVRACIRNTLRANMSDEYAEISFSILTGDQNDLPLEIVDYFRVAGLSHVLAVSGLHINFLLLLLVWPLKKLRVKKWGIISVVASVLVFYLLIADFSPSILRAGIMGMIALIASMNGRPNDSLNNLCCAVTVILVAKPFFVFDAGFLISVFAVLSIILFARPIKRFLIRLRFPKFLASSLSVMIAVQFGVLPITILLFNSISVYALLTNVILYYVIMITFMLLVVGVILASLFPALGIILKLASYGLLIIDKTALMLAGLPFAKQVVYTMTPILVCYIAFFVASRHVRKEKKAALISAICMLMCLILTLSLNYPVNIKNTITPLSTASFDVTSVVTVGDSVYIIGDVQSSSDAAKTLTAIRARRLDAVFISRLNTKTAQQLVNLSYSFGGFEVYFPLTESISGLSILLSRFDVYGFEESTQLKKSIYGEFEDNNFLCYSLREGGVTALFVPLITDINKIPSQMIESAQIIRSNSFIAGEKKISLVNIDASEEEFDPSIIPMHQSKTIIYNYKTQKTQSRPL